MTADARFDGAGPDALWTDRLKQGVFSIQRCGACGTHRFPPALVCASCGSPDIAFVPASGRGTVYSTTTVRTREGDYNVSIIELAEGPRMMSRVERLAPDDVRIGLSVVAQITDGDEPLVVFHPRTEGNR